MCTAEAQVSASTRSAYDWQAGCVAVIPCLNEEKTVGPLVTQVRRHLDVVLVIDDGSSDRTAAVALEAGAEVLRHQQPMGKGAALRSGWTWACSHDFDWALSLDGDGQHCADDIPAFFSCAERASVSLVVGNRMHDPGPMPPVRRLVNRWLSRRLSKAAGRVFPDSQCGFRLMRLKEWKDVICKTEHFEIESEVLLSFALAGKSVEFVPVRALYKGEQSKIHPVRDTVRWFKWWWDPP